MIRALRRRRLPCIRAVCAPPARSRTIWTIWQWNQATVPVPSGRSSHSWAGSFLKAQARRGPAITFREYSREPWVVAARHQHHIVVLDHAGFVQAPVVGVDALERKALRRVEPVVVGFFQPGF